MIHMIGRKVLFLAAGYVAGNVVSSLYTRKKWKDFQKDIEKAKKEGTEAEVFVKGFLDTQKNFLMDIESMIPAEKKKLFEEKKQEVANFWNKMKEDGTKILTQVVKRDGPKILVQEKKKDEKKLLAQEKKK